MTINLAALRAWRDAGMERHMYSKAKYWGIKAYEITHSEEDAYLLGEAYLRTNEYRQAVTLMLSGQIGSDDARISHVEPWTATSLRCKYIAAQSLARLERKDEALEILDDLILSSAHDRTYYAEALHLKGLILLDTGDPSDAADCFKASLQSDNSCVDSFDILVSRKLLSEEEELQFLRSLPYLGAEGKIVQSLYTVKSSTVNENILANARKCLNEHNIGHVDVLLSHARQMFAQMQWQQCYDVTTEILSKDATIPDAVIMHLACMVYLVHLRTSLYKIANNMVENQPLNPHSWYAVGLWYFASSRWEEARRFLGKALLLDPSLGPAWIAYAHSLAFDGEHEQATTAYSTAYRHYPSPLPLLYIGMQHVQLGSLKIAFEYVHAAHDLAPDDPFILNEMGVVYFKTGDYPSAKHYFEAALRLSKTIAAAPTSPRAAMHINLGRVHTKLGSFSQAREHLNLGLRLDPHSVPALCTLGMIEHLEGDPRASVARYHQVLSLAPNDVIATELLQEALEDSAGID